MSNPMPERRTSVLIVGGGLAGLSGAVFLAWHGVRCVLVERHPDLLIHPRLRGITARTGELYRQVGLEPAIRAETYADSDMFTWTPVRAETLAGEHTPISDTEETGEPGGTGEKGGAGDGGGDRRAGTSGTPGPPGAAASPAPAAPIDQDRLEILLRRRAAELGADIRFSTELTAFDQDGEAVTATLTDRRTGGTYELRADYLVAADGAASPVRERLGIEVDGPGVLFNTITAMVDADLTPALRGREVSIAYLERPAQGTVLMAHDTKGTRWIFGTGYSPDRESPADFGDERVVAMLRAAAGLPGVAATLRRQIPGTDLKVLGFPIGGQVARRYRDGRVFLAGDAAHIVPPTGGLGGNTGVQDAHNLAWKLAAVLRGQAGTGLLDTYDEERRPVGRLTMAQAMARFGARMMPGVAGEPLIDHTALVFGYQYRSAAVLGAGPDAAPLLPDRLSGAPGTRAPHVPVRRDGAELSTIDLYGREFVLLTGPEGTGWAAAAEAAARELDVPVAAYRLGVDLTAAPAAGGAHGTAGDQTAGDGAAGDGADGTADAVASAHGIGRAGALLVRPDGFVAWRSAGPGEGLGQALRAVLAR